ncbi:tetratricopeptide repeat protein [Myxosarcina sp. GI1]|uniref:tetratricopeptide repeat protein n=1 Tax=Myxosarcina sp. GI1 TaxID=1541065 RepID=UPI00056D2BA3|nr:tetratricopeptide repeat protein [Myxosarcina sp. GI1]
MTLINSLIHTLLCLLWICCLWLYSPTLALADTNHNINITTQQIKRGEQIAQKAVRAAQNGDFARSEDYWTQLIDEFPDNPAVWSNRGNVRIGQYKLAAAIADYSRSIELAPEYPDAYLNRGIAYEGQRRWQLALADYNRVLEIDDRDPTAYNNRGNAKAGQEKWQEALDDYNQAVSLAPDFALARANAALVTYQLGDRAEAIRQMRNLVRKYPMFADMRAALAAVLWVEGKQGEAESNWVATVGLDNRYQDLEWVQNIRRWPPTMTTALDKFLKLN